MNRAVRRGATPVLLALVATGLAAAPAGAAPTWVAPAVTLAEGTSARPPADSHVVVDAAGNATVAWVDQDAPSDGDHHVQVSTHPLGGPWSAPLNISGAGYIFDEIDIATNADGFTVAAWTRNTADTDVLEAATRLRAEPGRRRSRGDSTADAETPQVGVDAAGDALLDVEGEGPATTCGTPPSRRRSSSAAGDVTDPADGIVDNEYESSSPERPGDRGVGARTSRCRRTAGHPGRDRQAGEPSAIRTISSADHDTSPWSR